jgi:hypothetical protein
MKYDPSSLLRPAMTLKYLNRPCCLIALGVSGRNAHIAPCPISTTGPQGFPVEAGCINDKEICK